MDIAVNEVDKLFCSVSSVACSPCDVGIALALDFGYLEWLSFFFLSGESDFCGYFGGKDCSSLDFVGAKEENFLTGDLLLCLPRLVKLEWSWAGHELAMSENAFRVFLRRGFCPKCKNRAGGGSSTLLAPPSSRSNPLLSFEPDNMVEISWCEFGGSSKSGMWSSTSDGVGKEPTIGAAGHDLPYMLGAARFVEVPLQRLLRLLLNDRSIGRLFTSCCTESASGTSSSKRNKLSSSSIMVLSERAFRVSPKRRLSTQISFSFLCERSRLSQTKMFLTNA